MLAAFLGILKIIGIVIGIILLIVIVLLALVLFVPFHYDVHASLPEKDLSAEGTDLTEGLFASAGFHWLLHLVRGGISYPEHMSLTLKVLFFTVLPRSPKHRHHRVHRERAGSRRREAESEEARDAEREAEIADGRKESRTEEKRKAVGDTDNTTEKSTENNTENNAENKPVISAEVRTEAQEKQQTYDRQAKKASVKDDFSWEKEEEEEIPGPDPSLWNLIEWFENFFDKIGRCIENTEDTLHTIGYTITGVCDKIELIQNVLGSRVFDRAFEKGKMEIGKIYRNVKPKEFEANVLYGAEDPAGTAEVLAAVSILNTFGDFYIDLDPEFEKNVLSFDLTIKGKTTVFSLGISAWKLYFDKDIRKVLHRLDQIIHMERRDS